MAGFLLTRRWIWRHVLVLMIVVGCITAGFWQLDRLHQRRVRNATVLRQERLPPEALSRLAPAGRPIDIDALIYRRITVEGTYEPAGEVVLLGRELNGETGNGVLTPLRLSDGRLLIVHRGWVPFEDDRPPVRQATPPGGSVSLTGELFPSEVSGPSHSGQPRVPQLTKVDLPRLGRQLGRPTLPVYLWLQRQEPAQIGALPRRVPLPALSEGPHLSYAVQWFLFASIGIVGYPIVIRRELIRDRRQRPG
jgi:surfeit locus 1 family protein